MPTWHVATEQNRKCFARTGQVYAALPMHFITDLKPFSKKCRSAFLSENKRSDLLFMGTINPARSMENNND
jgi:hypothetical protein